MKRDTSGRRPWAVFLLAALMLGACSSGDEPGAQPAPTVAIADAPTATTAPTPTAVPTGPAVPTAEPAAVEPAPQPPSEEDAVIAAWERYLDLGFGVRDREPTEEALAFASYVGGRALDAIEAILLEQAADDYFVAGLVLSLTPSVELSSRGTASLEDCVHVALRAIDLLTGDVLREDDEMRAAMAELQLVDGLWIVVELDTGGSCVA